MKFEEIETIIEEMDKEICFYTSKKPDHLYRFGPILEKLLAVAKAVKAMKAEALTYDRWYTFVTCEFGEAVDEALANLEKE